MGGMDGTAATALPDRAQEVLTYWLGEGWESADADDARPQRMPIWYRGGEAVDKEIRERFTGDCQALVVGKYDSWASAPLTTLAATIIGDQLSRNAFRNSAQMYAADEKVLGWCKALVAAGKDKELLPIQRVWIYMPFMHSEQLADQEECVRLFEQLRADCETAGLTKMEAMAKENIKYAEAHRDVVAKWGRFPHRNELLGRQSTPEEVAGLADGSIGRW